MMGVKLLFDCSNHFTVCMSIKISCVNLSRYYQKKEFSVNCEDGVALSSFTPSGWADLATLDEQMPLSILLSPRGVF